MSMLEPEMSDLKIQLMTNIKRMLEADVSPETFEITEDEADQIKNLEYHLFRLDELVNMYHLIGFNVNITIE